MKPKIHENYYDKSAKVVMIKTRHNDHDDKYIVVTYLETVIFFLSQSLKESYEKSEITVTELVNRIYIDFNFLCI